MFDRKKIIIILVTVVLLMLWQTWGPVTLNHWLEQTLTVRHSLAQAQVAVVHACGIASRGGLTPCGLERVGWAKQVWLEGAVGQLILSGGLVKDGYREAEAMAQYLESQGVPKSALWLEAESKTTWQNALKSLVILKKQQWSKVLIITSPFHSARTYLVWEKVCPQCDLEIYPPTTSWLTQPGFSNRWLGLYALIREYAALGYYRLSGRI